MYKEGSYPHTVQLIDAQLFELEGKTGIALVMDFKKITMG